MALLMGKVTGLAFGIFSWVLVAVVIGFEVLSDGVVVLKDVDCTGFPEQIFTFYWFQSSFKIWNTFDGPEKVLILLLLIFLK